MNSDAGDESDHKGPAAKKQRGFVARQACDSCRQKKTRCDEDMPCSLCKSQNIECHYSQRKITKNEASYSTIMQSMRRIEQKIDNLAKQPHSRADQSIQRLINSPMPVSTPASIRHEHETAAPSPASEYHGPSNKQQQQQQQQQPRPAPTPLSFSAHLTLAWPGIQRRLPPGVFDACRDVGLDYVSGMELIRPPLPIIREPQIQTNWLSQLSLRTFKDLSYCYFESFNTALPILDQDVYFQRILPAAMGNDFSADLDTCIVLLVMALGSWDRDAASVEAASTLANSMQRSDSYRSTSRDVDMPGLSYFNEARRRMAFFDCDAGLQACQIYLLAGLYYAQTLRPNQWWVMTTRASLCSVLFWKEDQTRTSSTTPTLRKPLHVGDWERDMQSRLFWITTMFETLLADELGLANTSLLEYREHVPLPKFLSPTWLSNPPSASDAAAEAFFHYHFLSQIAHRILLTRIRESLFISGEKHSYPTAALEQELYSQIEQWRYQLPSDLAFNLDRPLPSATPARTSAAAWLRGRYVIGKYHIRRPLFHRALSNPASITDEDVSKCAETLSFMLQWLSIMEYVLAGTCVPYRYFIYSQLFGQLVVVYGLAASPDPRLRNLVKQEHKDWYQTSLRILSKGTHQCETVAKDYEIATLLYDHLIKEAR